MCHPMHHRDRWGHMYGKRLQWCGLNARADATVCAGACTKSSFNLGRCGRCKNVGDDPRATDSVFEIGDFPTSVLVTHRGFGPRMVGSSWQRIAPPNVTPQLDTLRRGTWRHLGRRVADRGAYNQRRSRHLLMDGLAPGRDYRPVAPGRRRFGYAG